MDSLRLRNRGTAQEQEAQALLNPPITTDPKKNVLVKESFTNWLAGVTPSHFDSRFGNDPLPADASNEAFMRWLLRRLHMFLDSDLRFAKLGVLIKIILCHYTGRKTIR
jgi:hypothetical protein